MTKMVALKDEAYEILADFKRKGESFSDVVFRLRSLFEGKRQRKRLTEFAGSWKMSDKESKRILGLRHGKTAEHDYSLYS